MKLPITVKIEEFPLHVGTPMESKMFEVMYLDAAGTCIAETRGWLPASGIQGRAESAEEVRSIADTITLAVNCHDELVAALEAVSEHCKTRNEGGSGEFIAAPSKAIMEQVRCVIAKAKGTDPQ